MIIDTYVNEKKNKNQIYTDFIDIKITFFSLIWEQNDN